MEAAQPWPALIITALSNTAFAIVAGGVASLWMLGRTVSAWSRSRSDGSAAVLNSAVVASVLAFALLLWTQAAVMAELSLFDALGSLGTVIMQTHLGHAWIVGTAALVLLAALLSLLKNWPARAGLLTVSMVCAALFAAAKSWMSHAGASGELLPFVVDWVHLVSVSVWAGVVFLAAGVVLRPPLPAGVGERSAAAAYIEALSTTATWSLAGVLATGAFSAWRGLGGSAGLFFSSAYGQVLVVKLVLVAIAVALGAHNRFVIMPAALLQLRAAEPSSNAPQQSFYRVLCFESLVLIAVLCAAAVLSTSAPPAGA